MGLLYKNKINDNCIKKKFLGGSFSYNIDIKKRNGDVRFFGIKIAKISFGWGKATFKLGLFKFKSQMFTIVNLVQLVKKIVFEKTAKNDYTYILLFSRSGETYLMMPYLKSYFEKNNIKNPVFVSPFAYLEDVKNLYYPEIPFIKMPEIVLELNFVDKILLKNKTKSQFIDILDFDYFLNLENKMQKNDNIHFYDSLMTQVRSDIDENNLVKLKYSDKTIYNANKKMDILGIKNRKFIIVSPESQSNENLSDEFWMKLSLKLNEIGYDVIFNAIKNTKATQFGKTCFMKLDEAKYISQFATCVIGLRSGFLDVVASNAPMIVLYTDFKERGKFKKMTAAKVQDAFTLSKLPNVNIDNIFEYNIQEINEDDIMEKILENMLENSLTKNLYV